MVKKTHCVTFLVDNNTLDKLTNFRFENRFKNQTETILYLLDKGFKNPECRLGHVIEENSFGQLTTG
jgi:hypothetical protein